MNINTEFRFGDAPENLQKELRANYCLYIKYRKDNEEFNVSNFDEKTGFNDNTFVSLRSKDHTEDTIPEWLKGINLVVEIEEQVFGYLLNGKFRNGCAIANVNSYTVRDDVYNTFMVETKILIKANGKKAYDNSLKLFEMIRDNSFKEGHVIKLWPVKIPEKMKAIGANFEEEKIITS